MNNSLQTQYLTVVGAFLLALVSIVLLLLLSAMLSNEATFISTELAGSPEGQTAIRTRMDIASADLMQGFPKEFERWSAVAEYESAGLKEALGADVTLERAYRRAGLAVPVFLLIVRSEASSSFHPPPVCYRALGYEVEAERSVPITLSNAEWAGYWRSEAELAGARAIRAKRIDVRRGTADGPDTDRRIALYFYVRAGYFSNAITMIRVSAPVGEESPGTTLQGLVDFIADIIPHLFEPREAGKSLGATLAQTPAGRVTIALSILIPLALVAGPRVRRHRHS